MFLDSRKFGEPAVQWNATEFTRTQISIEDAWLLHLTYAYSIHSVIFNLGLTGAGGNLLGDRVINLVFAVIVSVLFVAMIIRSMRE